MKKRRTVPVDLGIFHSRLPVGALVSILHRISGIVLVLVFPFAYYGFQRSLEPQGFVEIISRLESIPLRLVVLVIVGVFALHFFAGIRHLLLDMDIGIELRHARIGAFTVFIATAVVIVTAFIAWS